MSDDGSGKRHAEDVAFIEALARLLRENDLTELQVKPAVVAAAPAAPAAVEPAPAAVEDPAAHPGAVTSPMVGTVYLQAEPGAPSFISVGDTVSEGQTLLIVEAMKTMNHIPAPASGKVARILVDDGAPVEFGSPLVILE